MLLLLLLSLLGCLLGNAVVAHTLHRPQHTHVVYVIMLTMFSICCVSLVCLAVAMRCINKLNEISNISLAIYL